jgi:F420-dependent oxidoreductase-like protein
MKREVGVNSMWFSVAPNWGFGTRVADSALRVLGFFHRSKGEIMKLSMNINYSGGFKEAVDRVVELEKVGLDQVWIAEAYSFDAISQVGFLAAKTNRVEIGTGIVNVYSRTAALMAMTAAGCDYVSDGRFILGLGASGAQVIEGFHGVPYEKPMQRIKEYIEVCRKVWAREEPLRYDGKTVQIPLPEGQGTGLGKALKIVNHPVRNDIPIWWASLKDKSVEATAEMADGWLPIMFYPERYHNVWGDQLKAGLAKRDPSRPRLDISAGGMLAIDESLTGDAQTKILDMARPHMALYVGGMGARGKNFYNDVCRDYGFEKEAVEIQDLYLDGKKDEAAGKIPAEWIMNANLVGSAGFIKERVAAYKEAGVTVLSVNPVGPDPVGQIEKLRSIIDG